MDKTFNQVTSSTDAISDNEIINRVLTGEKDLYAVLVRKYNQRLYKVAVSIINDDEAEDAMQVAYIKAFENLGKFENRSAFSTWLTRILINECLQIKRKKQVLTVSDDIIENEIHLQSANKLQTPLTMVINTELKTILEKAISQLPEKYKTVFVMRELENMSIAETQECLNLSEANVKVRLNRAKVLLKDLLSSLYKKEDLLQFHLSRCERVTNNVMKEIENS
jgi:RNA polymerase sigma-70 factor (ECF subfamily)